MEVPESCIKTLKACMAWDQKRRPTVETMLDLSNEFLYPDDVKVH